MPSSPSCGAWRPDRSRLSTRKTRSLQRPRSRPPAVVRWPHVSYLLHSKTFVTVEDATFTMWRVGHPKELCAAAEAAAPRPAYDENGDDRNEYDHRCCHDQRCHLESHPFPDFSERVGPIIININKTSTMSLEPSKILYTIRMLYHSRNKVDVKVAGGGIFC